jgi:Tfp pilus assembly protein PilF
MQIINDVLAAEPRLALGLYYFGVLVYAKGSPRQAEESFKAALMVDPNLAQASFSLGELYEQTGKTDEAKKAYEVAARLGFDEARTALKKLGGK